MGSLTAGAKKLGISQPTMGRHIKAAELALGAELFTRDMRGLNLTETGMSLLEPAREMSAAAARISMLVSVKDKRLSGTVRIAASVVVSNFLLPKIIAEMRSAEPDIEIELVPSDATENLTYRDADIAIRMYRPTQLDVIAKHVANQPLALYAAPTLIEKYGRPENLDDLNALPFVGFDQSELMISAMRDLGLKVNRHFFGVRCDDQAAYWRLVCSGCGVGAMQELIGDFDVRVKRLAVQPDLPMWLVAPEALRKNNKMRWVWDFLVDKLS